MSLDSVIFASLAMFGAFTGVTVIGSYIAYVMKKSKR